MSIPVIIEILGYIISAGKDFVSYFPNHFIRLKSLIPSQVSSILRMYLFFQNKIILKDLPEDDPIQRKPDNSLAKEKLGWTPNIQLEEGLQKTIDYFKQQ